MIGRETILKHVGAVLCAVEVVGGECQASILYVGLGCDWESWERVKLALTSADLAEVSAEWVALTDKGRAFGAAFNQALAVFAVDPALGRPRIGGIMLDLAGICDTGHCELNPSVN